MSSRIYYIQEKFPPSDTININGFEFKIVYPALSARVEAIFVMSDIKYLVEKINSKHCL
jgi:hypothetical protein